MLGRLHTVMSGSSSVKRMRAVLDLRGGLIMAEPTMLELGALHDIVYDATQAAALEGARGCVNQLL